MKKRYYFITTSIIILFLLIIVLFSKQDFKGNEPKKDLDDQCRELTIEDLKGEWITQKNEEITYLTSLSLEENGSFSLNFMSESQENFDKYSAKGLWGFNEKNEFLKLNFIEGDLSILEVKPDGLPGQIIVDSARRELSIKMESFDTDCLNKKYHINLFNVNLYRKE